jgi:hypothetical protein
VGAGGGHDRRTQVSGNALLLSNVRNYPYYWSTQKNSGKCSGTIKYHRTAFINKRYNNKALGDRRFGETVRLCLNSSTFLNAPTEHWTAFFIFHISITINCNQIRRPGFDSRHYQKRKVVGLKRGPLSLVSTTEELLDRKVAAPVYKTENTAVGIRPADHVASYNSKSWQSLRR